MAHPKPHFVSLVHFTTKKTLYVFLVLLEQFKTLLANCPVLRVRLELPRPHRKNVNHVLLDFIAQTKALVSVKHAQQEERLH